MVKKNKRSGRKSETSSIGDALQDLLEAYHIKGKYQQTQLINTWEKLMGKAIAKRTSKIYIKERKMFVEISSAPLKQELNMSKSTIIETLNRGFEDDVIDEIIFL